MHGMLAFLKMEMIKQKISNEMMAKQLDVSPALLSRIFNNERSLTHARELCQALNLNHHFIQIQNDYFESLIQKYITSYFYQDENTHTLYQRIIGYEEHYQHHPYELWMILIKAIQKEDDQTLLSFLPIYHLLPIYFKQVFYIFYLRYLNKYNQISHILVPQFTSSTLNTYYHYYLFSYEINHQNYHQAYQSYQTARQGLTEAENTLLLQSLEIYFSYFLSCLTFYEESNAHLLSLHMTENNLNFAYYILGWNYLFQDHLVQSLQAFKRINLKARNEQVYFLLAYLALKLNNKTLLTTYIQLSQKEVSNQFPYAHRLIQWVITNKKIKHTKCSLQLLERIYNKYGHEFKPLIKRLIQNELLSYYLESHDYQKATHYLLEINQRK